MTEEPICSLLESCHVDRDKKKRPKYYQLFGEPRHFHDGCGPPQGSQSYSIAALESVRRITNESIGGVCEKFITISDRLVSLVSSIIRCRNILFIIFVEHSFSFITLVAVQVDFSLSSFLLRSGQDKVDSPGLWRDGAVGEGLSGKLLAHSHQRDPVHLDDVVVDLDPTIISGQGVSHHLLHVDVQLVLDPVDHVDPNHPDAEAGGGGDVVVHHQVHLDHLHVRYLHDITEKLEPLPVL